MPACRSLLALLVCASLVPAANPVKLRTLTGKILEGDLVSVSDKEVVLNVNGTPTATPAQEVLDLDLANAAVPIDGKYTDVELTDGSVLHCTQFAVKGKQVEAKLTLGQDVKVPLAGVASILNEAQDAKVRAEWQAVVAKKGNRDVLAIKDAAGTLNTLEGTFGDGDDSGAEIHFESSSGATRQLKLARIHAISFVRKLDPDLPTALCRVHDTARDVLMAAKVGQSEDGFTITTVAGATVTFPAALVSRLDYSTGKLAFLSDLEPTKVEERSTSDRVDHYRRDRNFAGGPIRLGKETYSKGLSLHSYTELVYDIGGQYKEFKAVLGVDPSGDEKPFNVPVKVLIEGDGKELFAAEVRRKEGAHKLPPLDVKGVKQLRIVVRSTGLLDFGHVSLADAKVSK